MSTARLLHLFCPDRSRGTWPLDYIDWSWSKRPDLKYAVGEKAFFAELYLGYYYGFFWCFVLALVFLPFLWKKLSSTKKRSFLILALAFLMYLGVQAIVYPERKYRFPLEPMMMILGAQFLIFLIRDMFKSKTKI